MEITSSSESQSGRSGAAIECTNVYKAFGHVQALRGASVSVAPGHVTAIFGDNGAGKSTLLRVLCGLYTPDSGEVRVNGRRVEWQSIREAQTSGIEVIHQDLALAPSLSVLENVFLGHEALHGGWRRRLRFLNRSRMAQQADEALRELNITLPSVRVPASALSGGQQQAVAIARAVMWGRTAVLMDEPTAALGTTQSDTVCRVIREVAARGLGVIIISHDIPRILKTADTVTILRRGRIVLTKMAAEMSITNVVEAMVGATGDDDVDMATAAD